MDDLDFHPWRWFFGILTAAALFYFLLAIFNIVSLPFYAANQGVNVIKRTIDADTMLGNYRWFHDADARLKTLPDQIAAAEQNLHYAELHAPDRAQSRMTELTGLKQICMGLVADYNARAQRVDTGFLRNPENWLPVSSEAYEPLPASYSTSTCKGEQP